MNLNNETRSEEMTQESQPVNITVGTKQPLKSLQEYHKLARAILVKHGVFSYSDLEISEVASCLMLSDFDSKKYNPKWTLLRTLWNLRRSRYICFSQGLHNELNFVSSSVSDSSKRYSEGCYEEVELNDLIEGKKITDLQKKILFDYYYNRKKLREIAAEHGLCFQRIHSIIKETLEKLCE